jgi:GNAT superfamily N-acetyltransferase
MSIAVETPRSTDELTEFVLFQDRINSQRPAYWPAVAPLSLPLLQGEGPEAVGREVQPFVVRDNGELVARALAVHDGRYLARWNDGVGHVSMFEALPDSVEAVRLVIDAACGWLRERGLTSARAGFGQSDFPFLFEDDDTLPPVMLRQNPSYYHSLLKEAGFESERAWVDYRIEVTPELIDRWTSSVEAATAGGIRLVPYGEVPADVRSRHWVDTWNEAFSQRWGAAPQSLEEHESVSAFLSGFGMGETSVIAYDGDEPVGTLWVVPELASALASSSRDLRSEDLVNFLGIGVREKARGRGVNMAMSAFAYLRLVERGAKHVSYTLVLDDNWPSRRTAEKLGASICANYMVYRRYFVR